MTTLTSLRLRGTSVGLAAVAIIALAACSSTQAGTSATPLPSASPEPSPSPSVTPAPEFREPDWEVGLGSESWTIPAIEGNLAVVGANDGTLTALNVNDGTVQWKAETGGPLRGPAAIDGDSVYVVSDDGYLYAFGLDGAPLWKTEVGQGPERGHYDNYGSRPAVVDGTVYAAGMAGIVAAVDAASGEIDWTFDVEGAVQTGIAYGDGRVHVTAMNSRHVALDAATGDLLWELNTIQPGTTTPVVMGEAVIIGSRSANLQVRDAASGDKIWTATFGGSWVQSGGAPIDDGSFAVGSSDLGVVRAYNLDAGAVLWNVTLGGWPWGVPAAQDGVVYATNVRLDYQSPWDSALHAIDASTGAIVWQAAGGAAAEWQPDGYLAYGAGAGPAVTDTHVIAVMLDGTVRGFALS